MMKIGFSLIQQSYKKQVSFGLEAEERKYYQNGYEHLLFQRKYQADLKLTPLKIYNEDQRFGVAAKNKELLKEADEKRRAADRLEEILKNPERTRAQIKELRDDAEELKKIADAHKKDEIPPVESLTKKRNHK